MVFSSPRTDGSRGSRGLPRILLLLIFGLTIIETEAQPDTHWTHLYQNIGGLYADFIRTSDGGFAIGGGGWCGDMNRRDNDFHLIKTDSIGIVMWDSLYSGFLDSINRHDEARKIRQMSDNGFLLVGAGLGLSKGMAVRTDSMGLHVWTRYMPQGETSLQGLLVSQRNEIITSGG